MLNKILTKPGQCQYFLTYFAKKTITLLILITVLKNILHNKIFLNPSTVIEPDLNEPHKEDSTDSYFFGEKRFLSDSFRKSRKPL